MATPLLWMCFFFAGMVVATVWPRPEHVTFYGLRVQKVLNDDQLVVVSPETGPVRLDICPENHMEQYLPRAGYVFCRLIYTPKGCMDVDPKHGNKFEWVVNQNEQTVIVHDTDTFKPWPDCHLDESIAQGGN